MLLQVDRPLYGHQHQGQDGESDLEVFRPLLPWLEWPDAPLGRGARTQRAHSPNGNQIDDGARDSDQFHGDADGFAVDRVEKVCPGYGEGERTDPYEQTKSAERHEGSTSALKKDEDQAAEADDPGRTGYRSLTLPIYHRALIAQTLSPKTSSNSSQNDKQPNVPLISSC